MRAHTRSYTYDDCFTLLIVLCVDPAACRAVCACMHAGHETTATTTAAALYCISAHPAVERQLLAELQNVLGGRPPAFADLERLPYLQVGVSTNCACA